MAGKKTTIAETTEDGRHLTEMKTGPEVVLLLGITRPRIAQLEKAGILSHDQRGLFDIYKVVPDYCNYLRSRKVTANMATGSVDDSQRRKLKAQAEMAEMEAAEHAGRMVEVAAIQRLWATIFARVRQQLISVPTKLAPLVAVEGETAVCKDLIQTHIYAALEELSGDATGQAIADQVASEVSSDPDFAHEPPPTAEADGERVGGLESETESGGEC